MELKRLPPILRPDWSPVLEWARTSRSLESFCASGQGAAGIEPQPQLPAGESAAPGRPGFFVRLVGRPGSCVGLVARDPDGVPVLEARCQLDSQGIHCRVVSNTDHSGTMDLMFEVADEHGDVLGLEFTQVSPVLLSARKEGAEPVCVGLATIPSRVDMLEKVVDRLFPQCDHMFVYLNGFSSVPRFLQREGITAIRSQDFGDYRDNSKFFGLNLLTNEAFFLTVDDDINYPEDYAKSLVDAVERYRRRAVIGYHGAIYGVGSRHFRDRVVIHFQEQLNLDLPVNVLGTGTVGFHTGAFMPDCLAFGATGMADLIVGSMLSAQGIPAMVAARGAGFLSGFDHVMGAMTLFDEAQAVDSPHDRFVREVAWRLVDDPELPPDTDHRSFREFESELRRGRDPASIVLPWSPRLVEVALKLRLRPLALACARGRWKNLARFLLETDERGASKDEASHPESASRSLARGCIQAYLETLATHDGSAGGGDDAGVDALDALDALTSDKWIEIARGDADPQLALGYAAAQAFFVDGPSERSRFLSAACGAYDMEATHRLSAELVSTGALGSGELGNVTRVQLRTGAVDEVVANSAQLCAAGWPGQLSLAMAGVVAGAPWAQAVVQRVFMDLPGLRAVRRLRELAAVLRAADPDVLDREAFARLVPKMPREARPEACSVLLAGGTWSRDIDIDDLPLESDSERLLWEGLAAEIVSGSGEPVMSALNHVLLSQGMVPVYLRDGSGNFFERLTSAPARNAMMGPLPKVTVIMAAYNANDTIRYALGSVLNQTYPNIEVVIVDDCSKQPLDLDWVHDGRIPVSVVRLDTNRGPYVCRNVAIARSSGEFITTHDADDWLHPQKIERQVLALSGSAAVAAYSRHVRLTAEGMLAFENNGRFIGDGPVTSMIRRLAFDRVGGFMDVRTRGDVEFKARLASTYGGARILEQPDLTLLALECPKTNSKRSLKTWQNELALARFKQKYALEHPLRLLQPFLGLPGARPESA